jgi:hypothetical protein
MVNPDTKEETVLFKRKNSRGKDSRCFFKDWFPYKNFEIQFRLDWNDKPTIAPTLDVDIRDASSNQAIEKGNWHHKEKKHDPELNMDIYDFKGFDGLILRFYTITDAAADQLIRFTVGKPRG